MFTIIASVLKCEKLLDVAAIFPRTLYKLRLMMGLNRDKFTQYVVCTKCNSIYKPEDLLETNTRGVPRAKTCSHVEYPRHQHRNKRQPCGATLFKKIKTTSGKILLRPRKVYCFQSINDILSRQMQKPGFIEKCEEWRKRNPDPDSLCDVYDGKVWKNFKSANGEWFFKDPLSYGCSINLDWFQPYENTQYSVGVIYLCFLNLPPEERYKEENVSIVGILPGPHEPSKHVNSFLWPAVEELKELYNGLWLRAGASEKFCKLAVLCASCDIPASRKLAGFVGFGSRRGCNKCMKDFPCEAFGKKNDYSGFDKENWIVRNLDLHLKKSFEHKNAKNQRERKKIEQSYGVRYSCLCELPYFDNISFVVIDPMHNLLLGTAKRMLKIWKEQNLLQDKDFKSLQEKVNEMITPAGIGRIPLKIASGFAGFTADQFKNWTLVFSSYALKDILPTEHLQTWKVFVKACSMICKRSISKTDCHTAEKLLIQFCKSVEKLYGKEAITINMHLHCHLTDCILNFGPVYSFWCFGFERFNGILGSYQTNKLDIEVQLMRRFIENQQLKLSEWPQELLSIGHELHLKGSQKGSVAPALRLLKNEYHNVIQQFNATGNLRKICFLNSSGYCKQIGRVKGKYLYEKELNDLHAMYQHIYPPHSIKTVLQYYEEFYELVVGGELYGSKKSRNNRSSTILARWFGKGTIDTSTLERRPGNKLILSVIVTEKLR